MHGYTAIHDMWMCVLSIRVTFLHQNFIQSVCFYCSQLQKIIMMYKIYSHSHIFCKPGVVSLFCISVFFCVNREKIRCGREREKKRANIKVKPCESFFWAEWWPDGNSWLYPYKIYVIFIQAVRVKYIVIFYKKKICIFLMIIISI